MYVSVYFAFDSWYQSGWQKWRRLNEFEWSNERCKLDDGGLGDSCWEDLKQETIPGPSSKQRLRQADGRAFRCIWSLSFYLFVFFYYIFNLSTVFEGVFLMWPISFPRKWRGLARWAVATAAWRKTPKSTFSRPGPLSSKNLQENSQKTR